MKQELSQDRKLYSAVVLVLLFQDVPLIEVGSVFVEYLLFETEKVADIRENDLQENFHKAGEPFHCPL